MAVLIAVVSGTKVINMATAPSLLCFYPHEELYGSDISVGWIWPLDHILIPQHKLHMGVVNCIACPDGSMTLYRGYWNALAGRKTILYKTVKQNAIWFIYSLSSSVLVSGCWASLEVSNTRTGIPFHKAIN